MASKEMKKRLVEARNDADAILATGTNRLLLIEAILVVCVFVAMFFSLQSASEFLLSKLLESELLTALLSYIMFGICLALGVFFVAPVVLGLFRLAERMQSGERPVLMDLFYFLSSRQRYRHSLRTTRFASLKVIMMIFAVYTISALCPIPRLGGILIALVIVLSFVWMLFPYSKIYSRLKDEDKAYRFGGGIRFVWFFIPWILLGLVSIGLLLVLDVIPRMLLTYFCDCNRNHTPTDL